MFWNFHPLSADAAGTKLLHLVNLLSLFNCDWHIAYQLCNEEASHIFVVCDCQERKTGQRLNIIIVSEGAVDCDGKAITSEEIRVVCIVHYIEAITSEEI